MNGGTQDPDEGTGMMPVFKQAAGKMEDTVTGEADEPTDRKS